MNEARRATLSADHRLLTVIGRDSYNLRGWSAPLPCAPGLHYDFALQLTTPTHLGASLLVALGESCGLRTPEFDFNANTDQSLYLLVTMGAEEDRVTTRPQALRTATGTWGAPALAGSGAQAAAGGAGGAGAAGAGPPEEGSFSPCYPAWGISLEGRTRVLYFHVRGRQVSVTVDAPTCSSDSRTCANRLCMRIRRGDDSSMYRTFELPQAGAAAGSSQEEASTPAWSLPKVFHLLFAAYGSGTTARLFHPYSGSPAPLSRVAGPRRNFMEL